MRSVITTDADGAKLTAKQLADAGVAPGERAVVEIRRYTAEDWFAEGEGRVFSTEEFADHLLRCPASGDE